MEPKVPEDIYKTHLENKGKVLYGFHFLRNQYFNLKRMISRVNMGLMYVMELKWPLIFTVIFYRMEVNFFQCFYPIWL